MTSFNTFALSLLLAGWIAFSSPSSGELTATDPHFVRGSLGTVAEREDFHILDRDGDLLVVGVPTYDSTLGGEGAVLVFRRSGDEWEWEATLEGDQQDGRFGAAVALHEGEIIIGAPAYPLNGLPRGGLFFYSLHLEGWVRDRIIQGTNTACFGSTIAQQGDHMLVGDPCHLGGNVRLYERHHVWIEQQTLTASHAGSGGQAFGSAVAIAGGDLFVAGRASASQSTSRVYRFSAQGESWIESQILSRTGGSLQLGGPLSATVDTLAVGAPEIVLFQDDGGTWEETGTLPTGAVPTFLDLSDDYLSVLTFPTAASVNGDAQLFERTPTDPSPVTSEPFDRHHTYPGDSGVGTLAPDAEYPDEWLFSAHVYHRDGIDWVPAEGLVAPGTGSRRIFGTAVALLGERAAIAGPGSAVYQQPGPTTLYERTDGDWEGVAEVTPQAIPGGCDVPVNHFGLALALTGDQLLLTVADDYLIPEFARGEVAIYERQLDGTWSYSQSLQAPPGSSCTGGGFGFALEAEETRLMVGEPGDRSVHFYELEGGLWVHHQEIDIGGLRERRPIALSGDLLAVGDPHGFFETPGTNNVKLFERVGSWSSHAGTPEITGPSDEQFAHAIDLEGSLLVVGAPAGPGRVYTYELVGGEWLLSDALEIEGPDDANYGLAVDLDAGRLLVTGAHDARIYLRQNGGWSFESSVPLPHGVDDLRSALVTRPEAAVLAGTTLLLGVPRYSTGGVEGGAAVFYDVADHLFSDGFESGSTSAWSGSSH